MKIIIDTNIGFEREFGEKMKACFGANEPITITTPHGEFKTFPLALEYLSSSGSDGTIEITCCPIFPVVSYKPPPYKKPPIGLKPRFIHEEARLDQVNAAIRRYHNDGRQIPLEWVQEHNDLVKKLHDMRQASPYFSGVSCSVSNLSGSS
jgi:hypothetical protein